MGRRPAASVGVALVLMACAPSRHEAPSASRDPRDEKVTAPVAVGDRAPRFEVDRVGETGEVRLREGRVTILVFWATWSSPDVKELYHLQSIAERHGADVDVFGLSIDDEVESVPRVMQQTGVKFPIGWDAGHAVTERWVISNDPSTYVIDRKGVVRGYRDGDDRRIEDEAVRLAAER